MGKILSIEEISKLTNNKSPRKIKVLLGGCFDVLHAGHIEFIKKAKALGDELIILLESDENVMLMKGKDRPINNQSHRAKILSSLKSVDHIITLPTIKTNEDYEKLVIRIQPDIIAITAGTKIFDWEKIYAKSKDKKIIEVMEKKKNYSTSRIIKSIKTQ